MSAADKHTDKESEEVNMKRREVLIGLTALPLVQALPAMAAMPSVLVYKNPSCGCCTDWVEHMQSAGFFVTVKEVLDTSPQRRRLRMPEAFGGCHTAVVSGYVLEGHVPAHDAKRMLAMRPDAIGLAVPGMPVGSPGMEVGDRVDPYEVLLVDRSGRASVFARYPNIESTT